MLYRLYMNESLTSNFLSLNVSRQAGEKTGADGGRKRAAEMQRSDTLVTE